MAEASSSTADAVNHLVDKIGDGLGQITAAISSHAPQAWELVVRGNYAVAVGHLLLGVGLAALSVGCAVGSYKLIAESDRRRKGRKNTYDDDGIAHGIGAALAGAACAVLAFAGLMNALDPHTIAMLVSPDGTTARDLLLKAL